MVLTTSTMPGPGNDVPVTGKDLRRSVEAVLSGRA